MATVARNSSEDALRLLDKVVTEGQNPAHFAKQLVRFLRNCVVAKVASSDSPLLQVSQDERARAGRVAEQFSEEDLARFLQIMLRTFDELGYRQEQRFHLELGVLKLVHAQRILPLEQVLSQAADAAPQPRSAATQARPAAPEAIGRPGGGAAEQSRPRVASPFEADRARKSGSGDVEMSRSEAPRMQSQSTSAAVAVEEPEASSDPGKILGFALTELEKAGHKMLASALESSSVTLQGAELLVTVAQPASVIDLMMGAEPRRIAQAAASAAAGRPLKVNVVSGVAANGAAAQTKPIRNGASARSRAAEDPVIQRMQEKFGAEIRTVIDHREKN